MAVNKVLLDNETLIDLTNDTVTESDVTNGVIFHSATGEQKTGTMTTTEVEPNPTEEATETLSKLGVNGVVYGVSGGSEVHLYMHKIKYTSVLGTTYFNVYTINNLTFTITTLAQYLYNNNLEIMPIIEINVIGINRIYGVTSTNGTGLNLSYSSLNQTIEEGVIVNTWSNFINGRVNSFSDSVIQII